MTDDHEQVLNAETMIVLVIALNSTDYLTTTFFFHSFLILLNFLFIENHCWYKTLHILRLYALFIFVGCSVSFCVFINFAIPHTEHVIMQLVVQRTDTL